MSFLIAALAGIFSVAFVQIASAADLPVKAPAYTPPTAMPNSWTGLYIGASAGYGWSDDDVALAASGISPALSLTSLFVSAAASASTMTLNTNPRGFVGGGQLGYNYQNDRWVWGLEADFSGARITGSATKEQTVPVTGFPAILATITGKAEQTLDFLGTLRGRLGFTPVNSLLIYVSGGLAYGHVKSDANTWDAPLCFNALFPCSTGPASGSASSWRAGWSVGGGVESMLSFAPHWSVKVEYLYYDLGKITYALSSASVNNGPISVGTINTTATADFRGNIVRVGLNYKFQ